MSYELIKVCDADVRGGHAMPTAVWMQRGTEPAACTRSTGANALMRTSGSAALDPPLSLLNELCTILFVYSDRLPHATKLECTAMRIPAVCSPASMAFAILCKRHMAAFHKHYSPHLPIFSHLRLHIVGDAKHSCYIAPSDTQQMDAFVHTMASLCQHPGEWCLHTHLPCIVDAVRHPPRIFQNTTRVYW